MEDDIKNNNKNKVFDREYFNYVDNIPSSNIKTLSKFLAKVADAPITWFREKIVLPNRKKTYYYHKKFHRVPTVDTCYQDDLACIYEAEAQFQRDYKVDTEILRLLRYRVENCTHYYDFEFFEKCEPLLQTYDEATLNYNIKYGDTGIFATAKDIYQKQKHRLIWERRQALKNNMFRSNNNKE